jgi:hypothetical protein
MKKLLCAALLALPLAAATVRADGCGCFGFFGCLPPVKIECGCNAYLHCYNPTCGGCAAQAGPWYLYWPLEAHFQTPALPQYPNWPSPMGLPPSAGPYGAAPMLPTAPGAPAPTPVPPPGAPAVAPTSFQPVGYSYPQQVPSYWYSR